MISIVIPVRNEPDVTRACLDSVRTHTGGDYEIIVIDNGSDAETAEYLKSQPVRLIENPKNLGCAAAWNQGIKLSLGEWICIINNDIVVTEGWAERLTEFYKANDFAVVSPVMREGPLDYDLERFSRTWNRLWQNRFWTGEYLGTCFLARKSVYENVGLFDESFKFGKFEDEDFYFRLRARGFNAAITGKAFIHHFGSRTIQTVKGEEEDFEESNRRYFKQKWAHKQLARKWRKARLAWNHHRIRGLLARTEAYLATADPDLVK